MLVRALELAFIQEGDDDRPVKAEAWVFDKAKGLVLLWHGDSRGANKLPAPLSAEEVAPMVLLWLGSDEAKSVKLEGWFGSCDHDGSNEAGWRVYCEDWGHVGGHTSAICAITPAVLWLGK